MGGERSVPRRQGKLALPAKLSPPRLSTIQPRPRLFALLDKACQRPVIWVQGPAGAGKTTLVASWLSARGRSGLWYQLDAGDADIASFFYFMGHAVGHAAPRYQKPLPLLTPEYLQSIPLFTQHFFEEVFRRLKPPAAVVFDNYQEVPAGSGFHEILAHALERVPEGITIVILSRDEPPPAFSRLRASKAVHRLGWEEIRFTLSESRDLLKAHGRHPPSEKELRFLHAKTEGWAAGLILLLEGGATEFDRDELDRLTPSGVYDYFASQIFDRADPLTQRFLVTTALLPSVTATIARQLTEIDEAGAILGHLAQNHFFMQQHATSERSYQLHALFREFLLARAQTFFSAAERVSVKRKAAAILQSCDRSDDAAALLIEVEEWEALALLIRREAQTLSAQGRSQTLEGWIRAIPADIRNGDAWLCYWLGLCRMAFDPHESRELMEPAFGRLKAQGDVTGALLAWVSLVDTFMYEWSDFAPLDYWIAEGAALLTVQPQLLPPELEARVAASMLAAMMVRQPGNPAALRWAERVERIVLSSRNVPLRMALGNHLIFYYLWLGDFSKIAVVMDALRSSSRSKQCDPLTRQNWYIIEAAYSWFVADWPTCTKAIADGLRNAEGSGVHLLDLYLLAQGVYGGLSLDDAAAADSCLAQMSCINSPRLGDTSLYHYQASSIAWYHGDLRKSAEHGRQALRIAREMGWPIATAFTSIELAVTLFDDGRYDDAEDSLAQGLAICRGMAGLEFVACMNGARFAFERGREATGFERLTRGLSIGARCGFMNMPRWNNDRMSLLLARALEHEIEPSYVQRLIRYRNLMPPADITISERWPWPLKIRTFGLFEVVKDGAPVSLSAGPQQKPLALLKALIAFGGKEVAEKKISDALWPDADGDYARNSFKVTVHRLRKLLGSDEFIVIHNGKVSLDARRIWIDTVSFERLLIELEAMLGITHTPSLAHDVHRDPAADQLRRDRIVMLVNRIVELKRGSFLDGESASWALLARERLRARFLRQVTRAGELIALRDPAAAIFLYEKALDVDPLAEHVYQGLMRCYRDAGRNAEGLAAYRRCVDILRRELDVSPSFATERLAAALQGR